MSTQRRILMVLVLLGGLLACQAARLKTVRGVMLLDPGPEGATGNTVGKGNNGHKQIVLIRHGDRTVKKVALTFDDGPFPVYTPELLNLLDKYHVRATFFVNGRHVAASPELAREIASRGHQLANHTFSHVNLTKIDVREVARELTSTAEVVEEATGQKMDLFRPPGGQYNPAVLQEVADAGYKTVLWTINTADYQAGDSRQIVERVLGHVHGGDIILMHSGVPKTIEALPEILDRLAADGYEFVTVTELPGGHPSVAKGEALIPAASGR